MLETTARESIEAVRALMIQVSFIKAVFFITTSRDDKFFIHARSTYKTS